MDDRRLERRRSMATRAIKRQLRRARRQNDDQSAALYSEVLMDADKLEMLVEDVDNRVGSDTPLRDFFQWIIDNQDAILGFIKAIIDLFSDSDD